MSVVNDQYRVGRRVGQSLWQVKQAPGWRVAHQCHTLVQAAEWLMAQGVDIDTVKVVSAHPWRPLGAWITQQEEPA